MTIYEFGASASSPRRGFSGAVPPTPTEFHTSIDDVTDEHHQNMAGPVQPDDFNAEVVVQFLRENGIDAWVDESTGGFRYVLANAVREPHVRFACVCLRASISYVLEAAFWCIKAKR
jgi:hypothetical protein